MESNFTGLRYVGVNPFKWHFTFKAAFCSPLFSPSSFLPNT